MKRCDGYPIAMLVPEIYDTKVLVSVQNIYLKNIKIISFCKGKRKFGVQPPIYR